MTTVINENIEGVGAYSMIHYQRFRAVIAWAFLTQPKTLPNRYLRFAYLVGIYQLHPTGHLGGTSAKGRTELIKFAQAKFLRC